MKVLLLGTGMQGKAALQDLADSAAVSEVIAADADLENLQAQVARMGCGSKVSCHQCDASDSRQVRALFERKPDVAIDLLPVRFCHSIALIAIEYRVHLVNTLYVLPEVRSLGGRAEAREVTILPEFGLDPGIDLVLLGEVVRRFDEVEGIRSYGAGLPDPAIADPPHRYRVTWTFAGVLRAYRRDASLVEEGRHRLIQGSQIFAPENVHEIDIEGLGRLEAYPNGDAVRYAAVAGLDADRLHNLGRYAVRWPGHCRLWKLLTDLHLMDDDPVFVDGQPIDRRGFLAAAMEPHIQLADNERDLTVIYLDATGRRGGKPTRVVARMIDRRDLQTGLTAMSRTVGFSASIGAQMIGSGHITKRGILSPVMDVPYGFFRDELARRGIRMDVSVRETSCS